MGTRILIKHKTFTAGVNEIKSLCNIVAKATDGDSSNAVKFRMSGKNEEIFTSDIEDFINAKWPADIEEIHLSATDHKSGKEIEIWLENELMGIRRISITGNDLDWVALRTKELEDFIKDHRNFHWIFHTPSIVIIDILVLISLMTIIIISVEEVNSISSGVIGGTLGLIMFWLSSELAKIFPFAYIQTNRPSTKRRLRSFLVWLVPTLFGGLILLLITKILGIQ